MKSEVLVKRLIREGKERVDKDFSRKITAKYLVNKNLFWREVKRQVREK